MATFTELCLAARESFRPVTEAIRHETGLDAVFTTTGGDYGALAITMGDGTEVLVTDSDGPLPWELDDVTGWTVGRYSLATGDQISVPSEGGSESLLSVDGHDTSALIGLVNEIARWSQK